MRHFLALASWLIFPLHLSANYTQFRAGSPRLGPNPIARNSFIDVMDWDSVMLFDVIYVYRHFQCPMLSRCLKRAVRLVRLCHGERYLG